MKRLLFTFMMAIGTAFAQELPDSLVQRLLQSTAVSSISPGYSLEYEITIYGRDSAEDKRSVGRFTVRGQGANWRSESVFQGYRDTDWHDGVTWMRESEHLFPPPTVGRAQRAVTQVLFDLSKKKVSTKTKQKSKTIDGQSADCFTFDKNEMCLDTRGRPLRYQAGSARFAYLAWATMGETQVPSEIDVYDKEVRRAHVTLISSQTAAPQDLQPSSSAYSMFGCKGKFEPPKSRDNREMPDLPRDVLKKRLQHSVVIAAEVPTTGIPVVKEVLEPLEPSFDTAVVRAVQAWRFEAATCEGRPIPYFITIEIRFDTY